MVICDSFGEGEDILFRVKSKNVNQNSKILKFAKTKFLVSENQLWFRYFTANIQIQPTPQATEINK